VVAHSFGAGAVVNCLDKDPRDLSVVLIAPALRLKEMIYDVFDNFGIPDLVYKALIGEYANRFGYNFNRDNPIRLIKNTKQPILIVHDFDDRTIQHEHSTQASLAQSNIHLETTKGLGHKRILNEKSVVEMVVNCVTKGFKSCVIA